MHEHDSHRHAEEKAEGDGQAELAAEATAATSRFSVSLPSQLLSDFDAMVREKGYDNRSLAVADMIRDGLVEHRQQSDEQEIAGTITLVYDHHKRNLQSSLTDLQHEHTGIIISTLHVHLDHDNCLEVLVLRGASGTIKSLAHSLLAAKGVKHGRLTITAVGRDLSA